MKSVLHIIGLGESSLGELRLQSYRLLTEADRVFVISIKNKIVIEMLEEGIPCERVIADRDLADISNESEIFINYLKDKLFSLPKTEKVVLALPGNPLPEGKIISELRKNLVHFGLETGALEQKGSIERLVAIMAELRSERGCPWDREQDHLTLKKYLIEEAYEVIDAIDARNMNNFCEELGDLLLQVVFHARIAQENGKFSLPDIINGISEKLIRRHPHVFGSVVADSSAEVILNWDAIKGVEKGEISKEQDYFNIPSGLPALMFAHKTQKKAAKVGFDWDDYDGPLAKIHEELDELKEEIAKGGRIKEELGDILFSLVNLSRLLGLDAEEALRQGTKKFQNRFNEMRKIITQEDKKLGDMTLEEMDIYWNRTKNKKNMVL